MNVEQILKVLIAERDRLNRAIEALSGGVKRRGRPPVFRQVHHQAPEAMVRRKRPWSEAQKKAQAAKMKAYWAKRRKK